jgi:putative DNA primase/helicase
MAFLNDATRGDPELLRYLQRVAGYCLTGAVTEHAFFFCYGGGGNGKGTFINMLDWLLGSYSKVADMDTFTEQRYAKHTTELAFLQGARLVTGQEIDSGCKWNESRLKTLTGGDPITAREMYGNPFTFYPTFKLLFSGNNKPMIKNVDKAMRRRMYLIPFEYEVPDSKVDGNLRAHFQENEAGGILQWAIEGCLDWQQYTLNPPDAVRMTTDEYFEDEDRIGSFFTECCEMGLGYRELTSRLYQRYREWCEENGIFATSRWNFVAAIGQKGYKSKNRGGSMSVEGLKLPDAYAPGGQPRY